MNQNRKKEINLIKKSAKEFSKKELAQNREEHDHYPFSDFFDNVLKKAYEIDFFHTILPENSGGIGQGMETFCAIIDNISQEDSSLAGIILTNAISQIILLMSDSKDIMNKISRDSKNVFEFLIAFQAYNNPSEIDHVAEAIQDDFNYKIIGNLDYLVLGNIAHHAIVPARIKNMNDYSYFMIDLFGPGIKISEPILSLGLHACPAVDIELNLAPATLIGKQGKGHLYFSKMVDKMNIATAAISLGIMKGAFQESLSYCKKREQGGKPVIEWSEMQMIMANMGIDIQIADMCISNAVQLVDHKEPGWEQKALAAAIKIQEMACYLTSDGIQTLGGVGYMKDFGQEKRFRDAQQIQSLLGLAPMKKIKFIKNLAKINHL